MPSLLDPHHLNPRISLSSPNPPYPVTLDRFFQDYAPSTIRTHWNNRKKDLQLSNPSAKLMHIFPSHVPRPLRLTVEGMVAVSISSTRFKIPSGVLKPTTIFGTPRRNDWIQNFSSLRSKFTISLSLRMSALVFNSTQLGGVESVGLVSQTF